MAKSIFYGQTDLPGTIVEIDSHLAAEYDTSLWGTTDSCVIIGSAFDGPSMYPVPVYSVEHAAYVFGKTYDSKTKKEASLVTGIEDCWNNGCRTIWAMRYNGIDVQKDFELCATSDYKLRIKSRYPSNYSKQVYMEYDSTAGQEVFRIYKPASRATIAEKMNGLVESDNSVMVIEIRVNEDYSFTKASNLADIIEIVNNHAYNNVLEMQIVDGTGKVVTNDDIAKDITLGYIYPGVYFVGRSESLCDKQTVIKTNLVLSEDDPMPYSGFEGKYFRSLVMNTDVASSLPIYYSEMKKMRAVLSEVGITMDLPNDYLKLVNESNKAFPEDNVDYEEMDMTDFDIYKRLGSGFATTAVAERRVGKDADGNEIELVPKIHEADVNDVNRVIGTGDGVYSILEDTKIRYHVCAHNICADTVIGGKLPKHTEFKTTVNNSVTLMNGLIEAESIVDSDDATAPHKFNFRIFNTPELPEITKENIYTAVTADMIGLATQAEIAAVTNAKSGEKCTDGSKLYEANDKGQYEEVSAEKYAGLYLAGNKLVKATYDAAVLTLTEITSAAEIGAGYKYFLAKQDNEIFIFTLEGDIATQAVFASDIDAALAEEQEGLYVFFQDAGVGENNVLISYPYFETTTMNDFVEMLNASALADKFKFTLSQSGKILQDEYVVDADAQAQKDAEEAAKSDSAVIPQGLALADGNVVTMEYDRVRGYDYSKHIMYKTTDNFARLLGQHTLYTELKSYPSHGVIGTKRISDVSKQSLSKKIAELKAFNWNMYIKNQSGRNLLSSDNLPYNMGRAVTVTLFQHKFTTTSNHTAIVNGATSYAGFVSQLDIGQSSTGQTINITPMYEFSRAQLQTLSDMGILTVKNSYTKDFVITDGITMAPKSDLLARFFNSRVMFFVEDLIRSACEPYIGKANSSANRNSLNTAITSNLNTILGSLIREFEFTIVDENGSADQFTHVDINYKIMPMNEIRTINNFIRVKNS